MAKRINISYVPFDAQIVNQRGFLTPIGMLFARTINAMLDRIGGVTGAAMGPLAEYTVLQLTNSATDGYLDPTAYPRHLVYVSDGTSNKRLAISDGSAWRFPDGAVVS